MNEKCSFAYFSASSSVRMIEISVSFADLHTQPPLLFLAGRETKTLLKCVFIAQFSSRLRLFSLTLSLSRAREDCIKTYILTLYFLSRPFACSFTSISLGSGTRHSRGEENLCSDATAFDAHLLLGIKEDLRVFVR